jgi:hypothetical protein
VWCDFSPTRASRLPSAEDTVLNHSCVRQVPQYGDGDWVVSVEDLLCQSGEERAPDSGSLRRLVLMAINAWPAWTMRRVPRRASITLNKIGHWDALN